jgi:hypothetical protein
MKTPPLVAAIQRLRTYAEWNGNSATIYTNGGYTLIDDLNLVLRALDHLDEAEHIDDRDMGPVFEVAPFCSWQLARKGLVHCLGKALVAEDEEPGRD